MERKIAMICGNQTMPARVRAGMIKTDLMLGVTSRYRPPLPHRFQLSLLLKLKLLLEVR